MGNSAVIWQNQIDEAMVKLRFSKLIIKKGNKRYYYACNTCEYNHFLNRYYPNAVLTMVTETLNNN